MSAAFPLSPSADLHALASLCRAGLAGERVSAAGAMPALAERHRVEGLLAMAVGDQARVDRIIASNLSTALAYARLDAGLSECEPVFLKGLAIAALGYAQPLVKQSSDIDVLIDPAKLEIAAVALEHLGYRLSAPRDATALHRWHRYSNQSVWLSDDAAVELHVRPLTVPFTARRPARPVTLLPGITVRTFADEDLYPYLVLHGALSGWFRLKWLADLFAFLVPRADRIAELHILAEQRGASAASGQALLLLEALFDLPLDPALRFDRQSHRLAAMALGLLEAGEPTERWLGTLPIHRSYHMLRPGLGAVARRASDLIGQRLLA